MKNIFRVNLLDMVMCISNALDLVSPAVVNHHKRVAYIASKLGSELGCSQKERDDLIIAGALHDAGALSLKEKIELLKFDTDALWQHAEMGYRLVGKFKPFTRVSFFIRYHHVPWDGGSGAKFRGEPVPAGSHILHLADRIAVLVKRDRGVLGQVEEIRRVIEQNSGSKFVPEHVEAFRSLADKEFFWLDSVSGMMDRLLAKESNLATVDLGLEGLLELAMIFSHIIDFRSRFTSTHSAGVAACAEALAGFSGFSKEKCLMMRVAGYLHDLGKLAVPSEIIEKPGKLSKDEFHIIKSHTFYTYRILETIKDLHVINMWASFHHERLDGKGYPFHRKGRNLPLGSRIMAVADVFTAITEDRPYRKGMTHKRALEVITQMAQNSKLDPKVVSTLKRHYDELNAIRTNAQVLAADEYEAFGQKV